MDWRVKGIIQKVLGALPGGHALHFHLQRRFGGLRDFDGELASKVDDWEIMVGHLRDAGIVLPGVRAFEIGTGWYPTFPFACYLAGAARVTTYDLNPHLRMDLTIRCAEVLGGFLERIATVAGTPLSEVEGRHRRLLDALRKGSDLEAASDGVIHYRAPADATRSALPDGDVDVVFSNSVLEHVPPDVIGALYEESRRVLSPGGLMFHSVNCGDHYAYVDRRISQLNYLQYPDRAWAFWNNRLLYQNRLRAHWFVDGARRHGFDIDLDTRTTREERMKQLATMPVHPQFADVPAEQLCITSVDFIARKPASTTAG